MKIWIINGRSSLVGQWELEIFSDYFNARDAFNNYVEEYEATICEEDEDMAKNDATDTLFWIEEHTID